jgi:pilus assembly protein Flp/PilA
MEGRNMVKRLIQKGISFKSRWQSVFKREDGQGLVEYAMIVVLILIVGIGALVLFRDQLMQVIQNVTNGIMTR